jgi:hypothetical protein
MRKLLIGILSVVGVIGGGVAALVFTKPGNEFLRPFLEQKLNQILPVGVKLKQFYLSPVDIIMEVEDGSVVSLRGDYSLIARSVALEYSVAIKDLLYYEPFIGTKLHGPLNASGKVEGDIKQLVITGTSDIASSDTKYSVVLGDLKPRRVDAIVKKARIDKLLYMVGQPLFVKGQLDVGAKLTDLDPRHLAGTFRAVIPQAVVDRRLMKKEFGIELPKTTIKSDTKAKLDGTKIFLDSKTISNLAKVTLLGDLETQNLGVDMDYDLQIERLELLKPITKSDLRGPFATKGTVKGDRKKMVVKGKSDLAGSDTKYSVVLEELAPKQVGAVVRHAKLDKLLYMVGQAPFLKGRLDVDAKLTDLDPEHLAGTFHAVVPQAVVDRRLMKKEFGIELPKTTIKSDTIAKLAGTKVELESKTTSNLAKLTLKGDLKTQNLGVDMDYDLQIERLELLRPVTGADLRGPFATKGSVKGDRKKMVVKGKSDLAASDTKYSVVLKDLTPASAQASVAGARLEKLLYMVGQPRYATARVDMRAHLTNLDPKALAGTITTKVTKGMTDARVLKKEFDLDGARIAFDLSQKSTIKKSVAFTDVVLNSSVAKITTTGAKFDLNKVALDAVYNAVIDDLGKLYFLTGHRMRGKLVVDGKVKKDKDLLFTAHSSTLGGKVDIKLLNDDLRTTAKSISFTALTDMLRYKRIFDSQLNADLKYNLATKRGKLYAVAKNGRILPNEVSFLLKQMARFDITKEIYKKTTLTSTINDKVIVSDLDMRSRFTHITADDAKLDLQKKQVYAKLRFDIKGRPVYVKLKGPIDSPSVSINARELLKERAKKELQKKFGKKIEEKIPEAARGLLKGLL